MTTKSFQIRIQLKVYDKLRKWIYVNTSIIKKWIYTIIPIICILSCKICFLRVVMCESASYALFLYRNRTGTWVPALR